MGWWQRVLAFFAFKPQRARSSWDPLTNPFDAKRVAEDLRLEQQGRELGAAGVPRQSDTTLSGPENSAVLAVEQAQTDYIEAYQLRLKALKEQISRADMSAMLAEAAASADQFDRQAANLLTAEAPELKRLEATARSRRESFERFRLAHRREDLPHYPHGVYKAAKVVLALFLIIIEAVFNAGFFAQGLSGGLIAGALQAGAFSLVNVLGSLLLALLAVRYVNHVRWPQRIGGFLGSAFLVCGIIVLGLYVSHYRDALFISAENAGGLAQQTFRNNPFGLAEPASWLLFSLSMTFGFVALWDGYSLDDPYPGYGRAHRGMVEAADAYNDAIAMLREDLEGYRKDLLGRLDKTQQACESRIVDLKSAIGNKVRLGGEMPNQIESLQSALTALLTIFRTANDLARQNAPKPDYFNSKPRLGRRKLPDFSIADDTALLETQKSLAAEFLQAQADIRARIQSAFNDSYSSLLTVDDLFNPSRRASAGEASSAANAPADPEPAAERYAASATVVPLRSAATDGGALG